MPLSPRRAARRHQAGVVAENYWSFAPGDRVWTKELISGVVTEVIDGPYPGTEIYTVTLDGGLGGGDYSAGDLRRMDHSTARTAVLTDKEQRFLDQLAQDGWDRLWTQNGGLWTRQERQRMTERLLAKGLIERSGNGYRVVDQGHTAALNYPDDPCTACGGHGGQGNGYECYLCDGSGDGKVERESRALGMTNANPENGLLVGLDEAIGQQQVLAGRFAEGYRGFYLPLRDKQRVLPLLNDLAQGNTASAVAATLQAIASGPREVWWEDGPSGSDGGTGTWWTTHGFEADTYSQAASGFGFPVVLTSRFDEETWEPYGGVNGQDHYYRLPSGVPVEIVAAKVTVPDPDTAKMLLAQIEHGLDLSSYQAGDWNSEGDGIEVALPLGPLPRTAAQEGVPKRPDKTCGRPKCKPSFTCVRCGTKRCAHLGTWDTRTMEGVCGPCKHETNVFKREGVLTTKEYEGVVGDRSHMTCKQEGTLPTEVVAALAGVRGEVRGEHRNRLGEKWEAFKADIAANGIQNPIFIICDYGEEPKISEGNHRIDAAVELGLPEVPVEVRYFGHAERASRLGRFLTLVEVREHGREAIANDPALAALVEAEVHTAADDYPELGTILEDRPNHEHAVPVQRGRGPDDGMARFFLWGSVETDEMGLRAPIQKAKCAICNINDARVNNRGVPTCAACLIDQTEEGKARSEQLQPAFAKVAYADDLEEGYDDLLDDPRARDRDEDEDTGWKQPLADWVDCSSCGGSGYDNGGEQGRDCPYCNGRGKVIDRIAVVQRRAHEDVAIFEQGWEPVQVTAGPFSRWVDKKVKQLEEATPEPYRSNTSTTFDWCRFRKSGRCNFPSRLDDAASERAGYAIWVPLDRGVCPREEWDQQKVCPVSEPGPESGERNALPYYTSKVASKADLWSLRSPQYDKNLDRDWKVEGEPCEVCGRPVDTEKATYVEVATSGQILNLYGPGFVLIENVASPVPDIENQGSFPVGPECIKKVRSLIRQQSREATAALIRQAAILELDPSDMDAGERHVQELIDAGDFEYVGVAVKAVDSGRVLLTQRTPFEGDDEEVFGRWEFPGGGLEDGEDALEAAMREFREETGLEFPEPYRIAGGLKSGNYLLVVVQVPSEAWTVSAELLDFEVMGLGWFHPDQVEGTDLIRKEMENTQWDLIREARRVVGSHYHVTTRTAVPSIMQHGLDNTLSTEELWSNVDDWDEGAYLWDSLAGARRYAAEMREMGWDPVILEVNTAGLDLQPDDTGATEVAGAWYVSSVPPGRIKVIGKTAPARAKVADLFSVPPEIEADPDEDPSVESYRGRRFRVVREASSIPKTAGRFPCPGSNQDPAPVIKEHDSGWTDAQVGGVTYFNAPNQGVCPICHDRQWLLKSGKLPKHTRYLSWKQQQEMGLAPKSSAATNVLYHLADKVDFKLDPKRHPENNTTLGGNWPEAGIFLSDSVERWVNGYGYWRPWVVEFEVVGSLDEFRGYSGEVFVPAEKYDQLRIKRVLPLDAHCREEFQDWGWTESYFETDFETNEPISGRLPGGYRYPGDARQVSATWQAYYKKRVTDFRRKQGSKTAANDPEWKFHFTSAWKDVRAKAKRIRSEGHVRIISSRPGLSVTAEVRGDTAIYETSIMHEPGRRNVAMWECGCAWASYSWGRTGRWRRFEGRMCSHALATLFEAQAQRIFGGEVVEQEGKPQWRSDPTQVVRQPTNYPKPKKQKRSILTTPDLEAPPIITMARAMLEDGTEPQQVLTYLSTQTTDAPTLLQAALKGPFPAKVRGWVRKVVDFIGGGRVLLDDGTEAIAREVYYPTFDPNLGLDLRDSTPHLAVVEVVAEEMQKVAAGRGVMVALAPPIEIAERFEAMIREMRGDDQGETADNMHVTLAYLPDFDQDRTDEFHECVEDFVASQPILSGPFQGYGVFHNDGGVLWATVDVLGLAAVRTDLVRHLEACGFTVATNHDWVPHMTLLYTDDSSEIDVPDSFPEGAREPIAWSMVIGNGEEWTEFDVEPVDAHTAAVTRTKRKVKQRRRITNPVTHKLYPYDRPWYAFPGYLPVAEIAAIVDMSLAGDPLAPIGRPETAESYVAPVVAAIKAEIELQPGEAVSEYPAVMGGFYEVYDASAAQVLEEGLLFEGDVEAELHDPEEPALPSTTADDENLQEDIRDFPGGSRHTSGIGTIAATTTAPLGPGHSSLSWLLSGSSAQATGPTKDADIAAAARAFLAKESAKVFSPEEQRALINEGQGEVTASNLDLLDIAGTHYEALEAALATDDEEEGLFY